MKFKVLKCHEENMGDKRSYKDIKYIVIHYTANSKDKALNNAKYFKNNIVKASAHYFVDEGNTVYKSAPLNRVAYSVGGKKYANTQGGRLYGICTNANSLSIEMCNSVVWNDKVLENTAELVRYLMFKYEIPQKNVIRHYDVTGKECPKSLINDVAWNTFRRMF